MTIISKIVTLFLTILISFINSGILKNNIIQENFTNLKESYPAEEIISAQNLFIILVPELNIKSKLIPVKPERFFQKIKIPVILRTCILINKNHLFPLIYEVRNPVYSTDLFESPDISFPFTFFW
jgi:hypothetical protein